MILSAKNIPSMRAINAKKKTYTAVSFFSGCGGGSTGLKMAGYDVRYANEFVPIAADTYELNAPNTHMDRRDIRLVKAKDVFAITGMAKREIDLVEASPPCKGFSATQARKKGREFGEEVAYSEGIKQRVDDLFFEYARVQKALQSKVFVAENVDGLAKHVNRGMFLEIYEALESCGYKIAAQIIDASMLGVPQKRKRLIIIGVRNDIAAQGYGPVFPKPFKNETHVSEILPHIAKIKTSKGFISAHNPSATVTASDHSIGLTANFSCGGFVEDKKGVQRKYTIDELKRIFTFPEDFQLKGKFIQQWERLGRSHVPLAVYHIAKTIREQILDPYYANGGK